MYHLSTQTFLHYAQTSVSDEIEFEFWSDLLDTFGIALLSFLLSKKALEVFPYHQLGAPKIDVQNITPVYGEAWVLFAFTSIPQGCKN